MKLFWSLLMIIIISSCSDLEHINYKSGDTIILYDGRKVIVERQIPNGFVVYTVNKYEVIYFGITNEQIKK